MTKMAKDLEPIKDQLKALSCGEERRSSSSAANEIAKKELKQFEEQSDKSFVIRAKMDRELGSL